MKKGIFLVLGTAFISGFSIWLNQFGVKVVNPYIFTGLRNFSVVVFLLLIILIFKEWPEFKKLSKKNWLTLILIGLIGGGVPFLLFFQGLSLTSAAKGSFIHKTMFLYVVILAAIFLKEKLNKKLILAILFLLLGNVFLIKLLPAQKLNFGDLLIFLAVLFWSVEQIISKKAVAVISPRLVAFGRMFFGFFIIISFWLVTGQFKLIFTLDFIQWRWTVLTSLILLGYVLTWYSGIKHLPISLATCLLALGGPITALLDLIQGKILNWLEMVGLILICLGVFLVLKTKEFFFRLPKLGRIKI